MGAPRAAAGCLPRTSQRQHTQLPAAVRDARWRSESGAGLRDSLLLWKTSHVRAEFILGYSTGVTKQHNCAEQSLHRGEHRCSGTKQARLDTVIGPLRSSAGRAKQSRHSTGLEELLGRGRHCPCKTASRTYTAAARAANKAAESLRTAALRSCHRSTGSGCGGNQQNHHHRDKKADDHRDKQQRSHAPGRSCMRQAGGRPGSAAEAPKRSSSRQHLLT